MAERLPIYRGLFMLIICFLGAGVCIKLFKKHKINYVYIFEVVPSSRLNQYQMYKIYLSLLFVWLFMTIIEVTRIKGYSIFNYGELETDGYHSLVMIVTFLIILLNPLNTMYREFRYELLYSLYQNVIAPFGYVRFKDFFLGDILTSMTRPLIDIYFIVCFISKGQWHYDRPIIDCRASTSVILVVSLIPFHIRFWQCINRYYYTQMWFPHLVNAGKYLCSMGVFILAYLRTTSPKYD